METQLLEYLVHDTSRLPSQLSYPGPIEMCLFGMSPGHWTCLFLLHVPKTLPALTQSYIIKS